MSKTLNLTLVVMILIMMSTSMAVFAQQNTETNDQQAKTQAELNLEKILAEQAAIAVERTSTGFYYPTGISQFSPTCGTFLGRDTINGGCYFDGLYHNGYDIMAAEGSNVYAIADGEIFYISLNGWTSGSTTNIAVFVKHRKSDGTYFLALYGHVLPTGTINGASKALAVGDRVVAGQAFAKVGDWSDGDHLHFGVVPTSTLPATGNGKGFGRMTNNWWADANTFVNPIQFIQTQTPWGATVTGSFNLSATPITTSVVQGGAVSFTAALTSTGGFSGAVRLQALNLPTGYDASRTYWTNEYVTPPVSGTGYSTLVIGTSLSTVPGTYTITIRATSGSTVKQTAVQMVVQRLPAPNISRFSWTSTPRNGVSFGGYVYGTYFVASRTRVFFCKTNTSTCYEHPSAGITVNSSSKLTLSGIRLSTGSWQLYVLTPAGRSARSSSFWVY